MEKKSGEKIRKNRNKTQNNDRTRIEKEWKITEIIERNEKTVQGEETEKKTGKNGKKIIQLRRSKINYNIKEKEEKTSHLVEVVVAAMITCLSLIHI